MKLNLRHFAIATLVPVAIMLLAMALKPLWRDEYWSLFFADPNQSLDTLFSTRWKNEVHPPLYYFFLYFWSHLSANVFVLKSLSLMFILMVGGLLYKFEDKSERRNLLVFFLVSLGSYWIIYFATEIRPYVLVYALATALTLMTRRLLKPGPVNSAAWMLWALIGSLLSMTHYFGALWVACLGFISAIHLWIYVSRKRFFLMGFLTVFTLGPVLLWLANSVPHLDLTEELAHTPFFDKFISAAHQFLRGLIVKTFGSNPLVTLLGFGGLIAAFRYRASLEFVLIISVLLTCVMSFILHLGAVEMIKERAFIVIMPAILYLMSCHLARSQAKALRYLPWVTAVMPLLFVSEYFKNKEKINLLRAEFLAHESQCHDAPILAHYRHSTQKEFYPFATRKILSFKGQNQPFDMEIINIRQFTGTFTSDCPVKVIGVLLPKNDPSDRYQIEGQITGSDIQIGNVEEKRFGGGRNIIWSRHESSNDQ